MPFKATYDKLEDIPEFLRPDFAQNGAGKWVLKPDAIEGGAELLNPGLAANRDALRTEKETALAAKTAAETRAATAERELAATKVQGGRVLGPDDAKLFDRLTTLATSAGNVVEMEKIVKKYPELVQKIELQEQEGTWREAAKAGSLNYDVLADIMKSERAKDLKLSTKDVEVDNPEKPGEKIKVKAPIFLKKEKLSDNTFKESEIPVTDYARDNFPAWLSTALKASATGDGDGDPNPNPTPPTETGPRLPNLGGGAPVPTKSGKIDNAAIVARYNQGRDTRPNPLAPKAPASNAGQAGTGAGGAT